MMNPVLICILLFLTLSKADDEGPKDPCPTDMLPPCSCDSIGFHSTLITCKNATNEIEIKKSLMALRGIPITTMQIFDSFLSYLPSDLFQGLEFERLFISRSTFVSLSDTDKALEGLEKYLKILDMKESTVLNGWDWALIKNLNALEELIVMASGPLEIDSDIEEISHLNIRMLLFSNDSLTYIDDFAFSSFDNLNTLSLKANDIETLKRTMFPNPANHLMQIIASHNLLQTLPKDLFVNMPALRYVYLADNQILSVDQETFAPVWDQLILFDVSDNLLHCDCRMKWMLSKTFPKNIWGKCDEPLAVRGRKLPMLHSADLWC